MAGKKENILDLAKHLDKRLIVKFGGGREVIGVLKGYDNLTNLVLDECEEWLRDPEDPTSRLRNVKTLENGDKEFEDVTRKLGLVVCRGTAVMLIHPEEGMEQIEDPALAFKS